MKQTAVEWLEEKLIEAGLQFTKGEALEIEQAKEMDKQQQGYSKEDLEVAYFEGKQGLYSFDEWFEQVKKK